MVNFGERLRDLADELEAPSPSAADFLALRARFGELQAEFFQASNAVAEEFGLNSGQGRLLAFLVHHEGEIVSAAQLQGVAGIPSWARRVRELRTVSGYEISSGANDASLAVDEYRLESSMPNAELAKAWSMARSIRKLDGGSPPRLLKYLQEVYPKPADKEQLAYVAKIDAWPRRIRELVEAGWQIDSSRSDPSLIPGSYRLRDPIQRQGRARRSMALRHAVLTRDGFACVRCGRSPQSDRVALEVHHVEWHSQGGADEEPNLETLCVSCHAGVHAVSEGATADELENPGAEGRYGHSIS